METGIETETHTPRPAPGSIVVGIDGSTGGARALAWAATQAHREGRSLLLVNAVDDRIALSAGEPGFDLRGVLDAMREGGRELLDSALASLPPTPPADTLLVVGDPRQALLDLAREAAMVVVGSRGRGPVASLLMGSVSVGVSRHASCPVVVVRPEQPEHTEPGHQVVVGLRTGRPLTHALEFAFRQASLSASPLTVVHARWEPTYGYDLPSLESSGEPEAVTSALADLRTKFPDVVVATSAAAGLPDSCLIDAAGDDAALIVVGTEHPGLTALWFDGDVALMVTEHAHVPVAVVPET